MRQMKESKILAGFFFAVLAYAVLAMVLMREVFIPHTYPSSSNGHIVGDPQYYSHLAEDKAAEITRKGLGAFELRPLGQGPAGIASLVYVAISSAYGIVLLNAILHALAALLMLKILLRWFSFRISLIAVLPLVFSPYMMLWFSQVNKESYCLAGVLLVVYGLLRLTETETRQHKLWVHTLMVVTGVGLSWLVRPYVNQMLFPFVAILLVAILFYRAWRKSNRRTLVRHLFASCIILASLAFLDEGAVSDQTLAGFSIYASPAPETRGEVAKIVNIRRLSNGCLEKIDQKNWRNESYLPQQVDETLKALMGHRCLIFTLLETQNHPVTNYSIVDRDYLPSGSLEALSYFPRAAALGIFAPWPDRWLYSIDKQFSGFYLIASLEAGLMYSGLIALLFWMVRERKSRVLIPLVLALAMMSIYGMANPFLGALYRYRYPWWILLICLGTAALLTVCGDMRRRFFLPSHLRSRSDQ